MVSTAGFVKTSDRQTDRNTYEYDTRTSRKKSRPSNFTFRHHLFLSATWRRTTIGMRISLTTSLLAMNSSPPPSDVTTSSATSMHRILCLHGKFQSGAIMSNKIAGARRKLARVYKLDFLDAPIVLPQEGSTDEDDSAPLQLAWWLKEGTKHILIQDAFDYVMKQTEGKSYDAVLGFSQGGTLATALALSGVLPGRIKAVVTAGSPYTKEAFETALHMAAANQANEQDAFESGKKIPKLHFAGETDTMVPVESTKRLCDHAGNGELILHEKGHLFPTKAVHTNYMIEFLAKALLEDVNKES